MHLLAAMELKTDVALSAALVLLEFRGDNAVDLDHDMATHGSQFQVGPFTYLVTTLLDCLGGWPLDPGAAAGFIQAAGFLCLVHFHLEAVDADRAVDPSGAKVKTAIPGDQAKLRLDDKIREHPVAEQDPVATFAFRAGTDNRPINNLPCPARCRRPAIKRPAVKQWLKFLVHRPCR